MSANARVLGNPIGWLSSDLVAGITLAAYAIPVSLAYATLAGLPPQVGVYGYLMGGLGYALAGSSRYLAIGPTSAISLMIAGTVGDMAGDNGTRYAEIATAAAVGVGVFCLIAWVFRLSVLVKLISDSVLTGFKAGAGLTIALTQLPALLGVVWGRPQRPRTAFHTGWPAWRDEPADARPWSRGTGAVVVWRAVAAWTPGRARRGRAVDRHSLAVRADTFQGHGHRRDPTGTAIARHADDPTARSGRNRRTGHGLHAACLHRGRRSGARLCDETPPDHRPSARAAGSGRSEHCNRRGRWLPGSGRTIADRGERRGRRAFPDVPCVRLDDPCTVPALLYDAAHQPAQSGAGGSRADGRGRTCGYPSICADVAVEPGRLSQCSGRPCRGTAARHLAGYSACGLDLGAAADRAVIDTARGIPGANSRHRRSTRTCSAIRTTNR